ncbi:MAG: alpha/beta hydrolase [Pseudomonadota bacterium]
MRIEIGGADIFFDVVGSGLDADMQPRPTLVMLHGGPGYDQSTLRPHFDVYADIAQVVYLDHRGCGRSGGAPETWTLDRWADDVAELCARLGIARPWVLGQSFGGMVAMRLATRHPGLASKLVLSSTAAKFELEETVRMAGSLGGPEAAAAARQLFTAPSAEAYANYARVCLPLYTRGGSVTRAHAIHKPEVTVHFFDGEMRDMDMRADLAAVEVPTLVLGGALDPVTPVLCSEEIAAAIGDNADLRIFEGCGHGVYRDDPAGADAVIRAFLQGA